MRSFYCCKLSSAVLLRQVLVQCIQIKFPSGKSLVGEGDSMMGIVTLRSAIDLVCVGKFSLIASRTSNDISITAMVWQSTTELKRLRKMIAVLQHEVSNR